MIEIPAHELRKGDVFADVPTQTVEFTAQAGPIVMVISTDAEGEYFRAIFEATEPVRIHREERS